MNTPRVSEEPERHFSSKSYRRSALFLDRWRWVVSSCRAALRRAARKYCRNDVPEAFHERFIATLYRFPRSTPLECVFSLVRRHNETLNCWTHLVAALVFLSVLAVYWRHLVTGAHTAPLLILCLGACIYTLGSTFAHTFNTMSVQARHACFFVDYAAVSTYAFSVGVAYGACSLPVSWASGTYGRLFIPAAFVLSTCSTVLSSQSRFLRQQGECTVFRIMAFGLPYMFETVPILARLAAAGAGLVHSRVLLWHLCHVLCAALATPCFGLHFPERCFPERFSFLGHSHQIMHTLGSLGTVFQLLAVRDDLHQRLQLLPDWFPSHATALAWLLVYLVINCCIVAAFILRSKTQLRIDGEEKYCCECSDKFPDDVDDLSHISRPMLVTSPEVSSV